MPSGCGVGGNAGGSGINGSGFLGIAFTSEQCYALSAAAAYAAIGMSDVACDLLNSMKSVRAAHKRLGRPLPDCTAAKNRVDAPEVVIVSRETSGSDPVTKEYVQEVTKRALTDKASK